MIETEVIIVGAGLAGLAAANYLKKLGIQFIIIDKHKTANLSSYDSRTTAINYNLCQNFQFLDIWDQLEQNAAPINKILIRNNKSESEVVFDNNLTEYSPMGYIIPNTELKRTLISKLDDTQFIDEQEVLDIKASNNFITVETSKNNLIKSKLILIADGKFSKLKQLFNIETITHDYKQKSYVFNVKHQQPHNNMAIEQFLPSGPLALLPLLNKHESSVVYTLSEDHKEIDENMIINNLNNVIYDILGQTELISDITSFPISLMLNKNCYRNRIVFIGDSLHSIHPVAGQGYNLSFQDIEELTKLIHQHKSLGSDIGSHLVVKEFTKRRWKNNSSMALSTHSLVKLFSNNNKYINFARNLGLKIFDNNNYLKKSAIIHAMGLK